MKTEKEQMKSWVENWKVTAQRLEEIRRDKLRNGDIFSELSALNSSFRESIKHSKPTVTSGLVEFQRLLKKL
jgi:flagellar biosynthesis/type III secretory pathway chaperone